MNQEKKICFKELGIINITGGNVYKEYISHLEDVEFTLIPNDLITNYTITKWEIIYQDKDFS